MENLCVPRIQSKAIISLIEHLLQKNVITSYSQVDASPVIFIHTHHRVMDNMAVTGEAAGFAAAECVKGDIFPKDFDGKLVKSFMTERGYKI